MCAAAAPIDVTFCILLIAFLIVSNLQILSHYVFVHGDSHDNFFDSNDYKLYFECLDETQVPPILVLKLISGSKIKDPSSALKQWVLCVLVKKKIMSPQGLVQIDEALAQVPDCRLISTEKKIENCIPKGSMRPSLMHITRPHEVAWAYITCYNEDNEAEDDWRLI